MKISHSSRTEQIVYVSLESKQSKPLVKQEKCPIDNHSKLNLYNCIIQQHPTTSKIVDKHKNFNRSISSLKLPKMYNEKVSYDIIFHQI